MPPRVYAFKLTGNETYVGTDELSIHACVSDTLGGWIGQWIPSHSIRWEIEKQIDSSCLNKIDENEYGIGNSSKPDINFLSVLEVKECIFTTEMQIGGRQDTFIQMKKVCWIVLNLLERPSKLFQ